MISGSITLNGVTEKQLAYILEFKLAHEGKFFFNAAQSQLQDTSGRAPQQGVLTYNGATITWNNDNDLKVVMELLASLISL